MKRVLMLSLSFVVFASSVSQAQDLARLIRLDRAVFAAEEARDMAMNDCNNGSEYIFYATLPGPPPLISDAVKQEAEDLIEEAHDEWDAAENEIDVARDKVEAAFVNHYAGEPYNATVADGEARLRRGMTVTAEHPGSILACSLAATDAVLLLGFDPVKTGTEHADMRGPGRTGSTRTFDVISELQGTPVPAGNVDRQNLPWSDWNAHWAQ